MGMFDYYTPVPGLSCKCGTPLEGWQGKGGPCKLVMWVQGDPIPKRSDAEQKTLRLEDGEFEFHTQCESCAAWVNADGIAVQGIWVSTVMHSADAEVPDRQALLEEAALVLEQEGWLLARLKHEGRSGSRVNQFADRHQVWLDKVKAYRLAHPNAWPEPPDNS